MLQRCLSSQRYNFLKANHNENEKLSANELVVYQVKDTIFWKQITTGTKKDKQKAKLFIKSKIQFFESKSQPQPFLRVLRAVVYQVKDTIFWKQITTPPQMFLRSSSCLSSQRYNFLKANHNRSLCLAYKGELFIKSKIQFFESKSQQASLFFVLKFVVYQVKDTIFWKQNRRSQSRL